MLVSPRCQYALRLALLLARRPRGGWAPVAELSAELGAPSAYLSKVAQDLVRAGLLVSKRGPGGGVALARPAPAVTLLEVVEAVDGPAAFRTCVLGLPGCGEHAPCPVHDAWTAARDDLRALFEGMPLSVAVGTLGERAFRLAPPV